MPIAGTLLGVVLSLVWVSADTEGTPDQSLMVAVRISGTSVYLMFTDTDCTLNKDGEPLLKKNEANEYHIEDYDEYKNGEYKCVSTSRSQRLYLKAKVCNTCVDLEFWTVAGIIVGDNLVMVGVVILVYYWAKGRKGSLGAGATAGRRARDYTKDRPPPVPNPDYEPIRKGQRDVYDGLKPAH